MKKLPSLITLFSLLAAAVFWFQLSVADRPVLPAPPAAEAGAGEDGPQAAAQGGFKPSERIRADSVVAFPADI